MGSTVLATCPSCGYASEPLPIGGGMETFRSFCAFPAYCAEGHHLLTVNLLGESRHCPTHQAPATPYDAPALIGGLGPNCVASWRYREERTAVLTDGRYLCPACHQTTLRFADAGLMWD